MKQVMAKMKRKEKRKVAKCSDNHEVSFLICYKLTIKVQFLIKVSCDYLLLFDTVVA